MHSSVIDWPEVWLAEGLQQQVAQGWAAEMISSADSKHAVPLSALCPRHRLQPVAVLPGGLLLSGSTAWRQSHQRRCQWRRGPPQQALLLCQVRA